MGMFSFFEGKPEESKRSNFGYRGQAVPGPDNDFSYNEAKKFEDNRLETEEMEDLITQLEKEQDEGKDETVRLEYLRSLLRQRKNIQ